MARHKWGGKAGSTCRRHWQRQAEGKPIPNPGAMWAGKRDGIDVMGPGGIWRDSMGSGKSLEFWDLRNSMMLQVMEKVNLCGQLRRGRRKQPQQNIFQASKKCRSLCSWARTYWKHTYESCVSKFQDSHFLLIRKAIEDAIEKHGIYQGGKTPASFPGERHVIFGCILNARDWRDSNYPWGCMEFPIPAGMWVHLRPNHDIQLPAIPGAAPVAHKCANWDKTTSLLTQASYVSKHIQGFSLIIAWCESLGETWLKGIMY